MVVEKGQAELQASRVVGCRWWCSKWVGWEVGGWGEGGVEHGGMEVLVGWDGNGELIGALFLFCFVLFFFGGGVGGGRYGPEGAMTCAAGR